MPKPANKKIKIKKTELPLVEEIPNSGNNFKKVLIVFLLLIMLAGIIGTVFSEKSNEVEKQSN